MRTIEIEDDVYNHILRQITSIGESATEVLRRLLGLVPIKKEVNSRNGVTKIDDDQKLSSYLRNRRHMGGTATRVFLEILGFALQQKPDSNEKLVSFPKGRTRMYFARSEKEIARSGQSTHPKQIPGTSLWALTNTDTPEKRDTLRRALRLLGYSDAVAREAGESLGLL